MSEERSGWRIAVPLATVLLLALPLSSYGWLDPTTDPSIVTVLDSADAAFSSVDGPSNQSEWTIQGGYAATIRLKAHQNVGAFQWNLATHKGKTVQEAELHLCRSNDTTANPLFSLVASTINTSWTEASCSYRYRAWSPTTEWTFPNSDFTTVTFGNYGTLISYGYASDDTFKKYTDTASRQWVALKLDPALVHALILDNYGLTVTDPRGRISPSSVSGNPYVYAKESGSATQPKLYIKFATATDTNPPGAVTSLTAARGPENKQMVLTFNAPTDPDTGDAAFGYNVRYSFSNNFAAATAVDRWRIPRPKAPGVQQQVLLEGLTAGVTYYFFVQAYDAVGNVSSVVSVTGAVPVDVTTPTLATGLFTTPNPAGKAVRIAVPAMKYWAASEMAKINPVTGNRIEDGYTGTGADDYKKANAVWDAFSKTISLQACRNEVVGCQLILQKLVTSLTNVQVTVSDLTGPGGQVIPANPYVELYQLHYVNSGGTYYPEAAIPLFNPSGVSGLFPSTFSIPDTNHNPSGVNQSVWLDLYVPTYTGTPSSRTPVQPADYKATITINATQLIVPVTITLKVRVSPVTIKDASTFLMDYNGYSSGAYDPNQSFFDWDFGGGGYFRNTVLRYFQTLHKHRASPNVVPYGWQGLPSNTDRAPTLMGFGPTRHTYDWSLVDLKYGRFFTTLASYEQTDPSKLGFSRLNPTSAYYGPGENTPASTFYLPFFESWPIPLVDANYGFDAPAPPGHGGVYWNNLIDGSTPGSFFAAAPDIYAGFGTGYTTGTRNVVTDWFTHANDPDHKWTKTNFQAFLNNKYSYGTTCNALWVLEECESADDFRAVGYLHQLWRDGQALANAPDVQWQNRLDISDRWGQNWGQLDNRTNWQVLSSGAADWHWPNKAYRKYFFDTDKQEDWGWYGDGPSITAGNIGLAQNFLKRWCQGFNGAVPWFSCFQTSWTTANDLSLIYSGNGIPGIGVYEGCIVSIRVKAVRQVEQVIELLNAWASCGDTNINRQRVRDSLATKYADKSGSTVTWGFPFSGLDENKFYQLRSDLQAQLEGNFLVGDLNGDGVVDALDLVRLALGWGTTSTSPSFDSFCDLSHDNAIDVVDLLTLAANWAKTKPVP